MSYLKGACGLIRMDIDSTENMYGKLGMSGNSKGMSCGVVEVVKCSTSRSGCCGCERKVLYKMEELDYVKI